MKKAKYNNEYTQEPVDKHALDFDLLKRLISYLKPYKTAIFIAAALLLASKIIEAIIPIVIGKVTQKILDASGISFNQGKELFDNVFFVILLLICCFGVSYLFEALSVVIKNKVGQNALLNLRKEVYRHILSLPLKFFDRQAVGRLMTRTIHDVDQINQMFAESVIPILGSAILFICVYIGIIFIDWRVALLVAFFTPFIFWHTNHFRKRQRISFNRVRLVVAAMNSFVQEHLMGIAVIRKFGRLDSEQAQFDKINNDQKNAYIETIENYSQFAAGIDFAISVFMIVIFAVLVLVSPSQEFQAGTYFTLSLYSLMIFRPLADLAERYNVLQSAMAASERIFRILDQEEEPSEEGLQQIHDIETVEFDDVWFAYEGENWVLRGVSFSMRKAVAVALVGLTGAGKTSIINLLLRLYDYQKGSIRINGIDIKKISKKSLREHFHVVLQDPVIFSGSILENIRLFDDHIAEEMAVQAIDDVDLKLLVDKLPEGINTHISERGSSLSVGEMQLISLARTMAQERSVLILDEATANIDSTTEKTIQKTLKKILKDKMSLVIAHRLSTIKDVDRILVLHQGQVVESGTHAQLMSVEGIYEKLYRLSSIQGMQQL